VPKPIPKLEVASPETVFSLANELNTIGLFVGTGTDTKGAPVFELERPMTRLESLAVILRLLGLESAADKAENANPFKDVPEWGEKTTAYAYSIGLTFGVNDEHTLFAPDRVITAKEFSAFLLRVLGFAEAKNDFTFEKALDKAVEVKLFSLVETAKFNKTEFLRAEAVVSISNALITYVKDSDSRLIDRLVSQGVISKESANGFTSSYQSIYKR
jgi:hypothetical protein